MHRYQIINTDCSKPPWTPVFPRVKQKETVSLDYICSEYKIGLIFLKVNHPNLGLRTHSEQ